MVRDTMERSRGGLSLAELEAEEVVELAEREELSLVNANLAVPINVALAANVLSDNSVAYGDAQQHAPIGQGLYTQPPTLPA